MTCKTSGCREPAQNGRTRCRKHQRAYLKRIGVAVGKISGSGVTEVPPLRIPQERSLSSQPPVWTPPPPARWQQFEQHVLMDLHTARKALASVSGLAMSDGMIKWSGEARELASRVATLVREIEENAQRVLREGCR